MTTKESLTEYAFQEIKKGIESGTYRSGEKLSVRHLAKDLNVGQTPVINAINRLVSLGLLETKERSGTFVCDTTGPTMQEVVEVRKLSGGNDAAG